MMKYVVTGHKEHGKDTLCELLETQGFTWIGSSWYACQKFIYPEMRLRLDYGSADQCYQDRDNHRKLWFDRIVDYNTPDLARMGREMFENHDIYCGLRNIDELNALRDAHLVDLTIWVDAGQRKEKESSDSLTISPDDCDITITNNGTKQDLFFKAMKLAFLLRYAEKGMKESL